MTKKSHLVVRDQTVYHLGLRPHQICPNLILVGDPNRAHLVAAYFDAVQHQVQRREFVTITGTYQGVPISVMGTGIGTDNVEIAIIEAYTLLAFDLEQDIRKPNFPEITIIRVGTSGGIQENIQPGTLAISEYGLGLDSTGLFYDHPAADPLSVEIEKECLHLINSAMPDENRFKGKIFPYVSRATPKVSETLGKHALNGGQDPVTGITVSTPGFYGPSGRYIQGLSNSVPGIKMLLSVLKVGDLRIVNMEMESSLIFHLCAHLGIQCGTICPIISHPFSNAALFDYQKPVDEAIKAALNTIKELNG